MFLRAFIIALASCVIISSANVLLKSNGAVTVVVQLEQYENSAGKLSSGDPCPAAPKCDPKFSGSISGAYNATEDGFLWFSIPAIRGVSAVNFPSSAVPVASRRFEVPAMIGQEIDVEFYASDSNLRFDDDTGFGRYPIIAKANFKYQVGAKSAISSAESDYTSLSVSFSTIARK